MKCVCAWCGLDLGTVEADNLPEDDITDGICDACSARVIKQADAFRARREAARVPACQRRI